MNPPQALHELGQSLWPLPTDGGYSEAVIEEFQREGLDFHALVLRLQREGVDGFATSWHALLARIRERRAAPGLRKSAPL